MNEILHLKKCCHQLLDIYIMSNLNVPNNKKHYHRIKRNAYHKLAQELRVDAHKCHFKNMHTIDELRKALEILTRWSKEL